jgi:NADPH:quinone reductase
MKAIVVHEFGGPEVLKLEDAPDPTPGDGEVLVEVRAVGINPFETYMRAGNYAIKPPLPFTLGVDAAGTVATVGKGVTSVAVGARVWIAPGLGTSTGTYAQKVVCSATRVHPLPDRISFAQGAALGVTYLTAQRALALKAQAQPAETLLVHGASGGVGTAAVQIARAQGLTVIGTAGSPEGRQAVLDSGAHHVVDHKSPTYREEIVRLTGGRGPDVILEMVAHVNLNHDLEMIASNGRIVVIGSRGNIEVTPRNFMAKDSIVTGMTLWATPEAHWARLFAAIEAGLQYGTLNPVIQIELPLADAPKAHQLVMEGGSRGKIVLIP